MRPAGALNDSLQQTLQNLEFCWSEAAELRSVNGQKGTVNIAKQSSPAFGKPNSNNAAILAIVISHNKSITLQSVEQASDIGPRVRQLIANLVDCRALSSGTTNRSKRIVLFV